MKNKFEKICLELNPFCSKGNTLSIPKLRNKGIIAVIKSSLLKKIFISISPKEKIKKNSPVLNKILTE